MKNIYIYALREPEDGTVRYVGKTNDVRARRKAHFCMNMRRGHNSRLYDWLLSLRKAGEKPVMTILSVCPFGVWEAREKEWIAYFTNAHINLYNITTGGGTHGLWDRKPVSKVVKQKLREAQMRRLADPDYRQRQLDGCSEWQKNMSEETRKKCADAGRAELEKHRDKGHQSQGSKKFWKSLTPEQRVEFNRKRLRNYSTEKRCEASKKRWNAMDTETRKHCEARLHKGLLSRWERDRGKPMLEEQKARISAGLKRAYAEGRRKGIEA